MSDDVTIRHGADRHGADRHGADHRAIADCWTRIQTVFTSPSVTDWYLDRIDAPITDVDARRVLCVIARNEPVRVTDVANAVGMSMSNASRVVKRLVADELVRRATPEFDRRVTLLEVTEAGREAVRRIDATDLMLLGQNLSTFSAEEVASFAELLTRFAQQIAAWHESLPFAAAFAPRDAEHRSAQDTDRGSVLHEV